MPHEVEPWLLIKGPHILLSQLVWSHELNMPCIAYILYYYQFESYLRYGILSYIPYLYDPKSRNYMILNPLHNNTILSLTPFVVTL